MLKESFRTNAKTTTHTSQKFKQFLCKTVGILYCNNKGVTQYVYLISIKTYLHIFVYVGLDVPKELRKSLSLAYITCNFLRCAQEEAN